VSKLVDKIKNFWLGEEDTYDDDGFDELFRVQSSESQQVIPLDSGILDSNAKSSANTNSTGKDKTKTDKSTKSNHLKVLSSSSSPYSATNQVVVLEPNCFEQARDVLQYLRKGSSVVLNLDDMEANDSQRLLDFVCGGIYALDGSQKRVGNEVFLLVPNSVNISAIERLGESKDHFWN